MWIFRGSLMDIGEGEVVIASPLIFCKFEL